MSRRRARKQMAVGRQLAEMAWTAPQVMGHRILRMAAAGASPSARDLREFQLMGSEKAAAFALSWQAMAAQMWVSNQQFALSMLRALWFPWLFRWPSSSAAAHHFGDALLDVAHKGLAPVHRRVTFNHKRLMPPRT